MSPTLAERKAPPSSTQPATDTSTTADADALKQQANAAARAGRYADAEQLYRRASAIYERTLGAEDPKTVTSLSDLGSSLMAQGRYADAEPIFRRILPIYERDLGAEHPYVATVVDNLGTSLYWQSRYAEAEPLYRRALAIREKVLGPEDNDTEGSRNNLAEALEAQGRFAEAEPLLRNILAFGEKTAPDQRNTATSLNNLAELLRDQGRYAEAEPYYRRALAISEKAEGPEHPDTALDLENLAALLRDQGRYAEAEPLLRRGLAIFEKTLGPEHPYTASSLNNLATLLNFEGRYAEAEPLLRRALAIREKIAGPDRPDTAASLDDLASLLRDEGRYDEAEGLLRRAVAILEKAQGPNYPTTATALNDLGVMLSDHGRYADAEPLLRRALAIREKVLGPTHRDTAASLNNLAILLFAEGRYADAEPLYRRAVTIFETSLGSQHRYTATGYENLGVLEMLQGAPGRAVSDFRPACAAITHMTSGAETGAAAKSIAGLSSTSCSQYLARALWAWSAKGGGATAKDRPSALQAEAFSGAQRSTASAAGEALAQASARTLAAKAGAGTEAVDYEAALVERDRLNNAFAQAAGAGSTEQQTDFAKARDATETKIASLEAALKAKAPLYWDYRSPQPIDVQALQATAGDDAKLLHANEALVLWMVTPGKDKGLVFAVSKSGFAWAEIGLTGDEVKDKVDTLRFKIDPESFSRGATGARSESGEPFDRATAHDLYAALLGDAKIQAVINGQGVDTLIVVPSGPLTRLPPSLLVVDAPQGMDADPAAQASTHWLIRDKAIAVLPAVSSLRTLRQLLATSRSTTDVKLLALADPDFKGTGAIPVAPGENQMAPRGAPLSIATLERDGRGTDALQDLPPLYGTLSEGRVLAQTLDPGDPSALLLGPDASKTNLLRRQADGSLARTRVLDFSTHGLLTGDIGLNEPALALAHPPKTGADPSDDGLLKASEAAALTLNADWVVLSACNTAAGDSAGAEGLSGLARAFFHAGASTLLVSHWRVDDSATEQLITETFRFRQQNEPKVQALRSSILAMLDDPTHKHSDPKYWAPFVVVGEPE